MFKLIFIIIITFANFAITINGYRVIRDKDIPELDYLDPAQNPCDDFYRFTCGNFKNVHPLPPEDKAVDHFSLLQEELTSIGQEILSSEKLDSDPIALKKVKIAYKACMDDEFPNTATMTVPELQIIDEFDGMPLIGLNDGDEKKFKWNTLGKMVAQFGLQLIFDYTVYPQFDKPDEFFILMTPDGFENPAMIRPDFQKSYDQIIQDGFKEMLRDGARGNEKSKMAVLPTDVQPFDIFLRNISRQIVNQRNPSKTDEDIIADLDKMAEFMRTLYAGGIVEENATIHNLTYYPTLGELQDWTVKQFGDGLDLNWVEYFSNIFSTAGVKITKDLMTYPYSAKWLYGVLNLVRLTDPAVIKNFALLRIFLFLAPDSDASTRGAFEEYFRAKNQPLYPRWQYCTRKILDATDTASVSFAAAYGYQRYHFNINKLQLAAEMVTSLHSSFLDNLQTIDWMDDESKMAAYTKAQNILVLLGFPDFVEEEQYLDKFYRNIRMCEWDNYGNARRMRAFKQAYLFSQLGQLRARNFWDKSTFDANAYYNRPNNRIVLPLAMLNGVFFRGANILDYSRLGAIIGHEITHGFDNSGKNYNQDGAQVPWWTSETSANFKAKTQCFIEQYNKYYVEDGGFYVNGTISLDENLADNGGIRDAFRSFIDVMGKYKIQVESVYTPEQLFFIGYGTMWCTEVSPAYLLNYNQSKYAPNHFRVNGAVSNMAEFAEAFKCPAASPMNPENKCILW